MNEMPITPGEAVRRVDSRMFEQSVIDAQVNRKLLEMDRQIVIRTTALQCAAQVAANLPLQSAYNVLDMAKQFENYLKG